MNPQTSNTPAPTVVDTLIFASWIIPVIPRKQLLSDHAIAIAEGKIVAIIPSTEARQQYRAKHRLELPGQALMPGLVNSHGHIAMNLFRGMADDEPLQKWLQESIWPAEAKWVSEEFVFDGSQLAMAEMLRSGTTTFSDMYFFPEATARAASSCGMRAQLSFPIFDFGNDWGSGPDDFIHKGLQLRDDYKHNDLIDIAFGPHAPYTVGDTSMQQVATLAAELDMNIQIHLHETAGEVTDAVAATGKRPIERLNDLGLLGPRSQCVHMTAVSPEDIELLQLSGAHVVHCPQSNLKLASGFCPVQELLDADINVAIGTDSAASNNNLDMFAETRSAALLAKAVAGNATALPNWQALEMATISGARALGIDHKVGSLETGKEADLIAIDLSAIEQQPIYDPVSQLVYTACANRVSHSWIKGQHVLKESLPSHLDLNQLSDKAAAWRRKIRP